MYAVIEVGSKQYNVKKDDIIEVGKQELAQGGQIDIDKVLLVADGKEIKVGQPYLKGVKVEAAVLKHSLGKKVLSYKHRRRKNSHWQKGHRDQLTQLKIKSIVFS